MENVIEVNGLTKSFNGHPALNGVSFTVPKGSIYGFLGPNGAGKTTTIKILLGLISKDAGSAHVLGERVEMDKGTAFKRHIGYLPQDPVFPAGLTGKEVLQLVQETYGLNQAQHRNQVTTLLESFDLGDAANRRVDSYSRGMKQRLGLAAVLLPDPDLIILDEPVSALDPEGRFQVLSLIDNLRGRATVFFSSHILADVERVCDHLVLINKGQTLAESRLDALLNRYSTQQYRLIIQDGAGNRAKSIAEGLSPVREVRQVGDTLYITGYHGRLNEIGEKLMPALVENNINVIEFSLVKRDLEKIFLDIVGNGKGSDGNA